MMRFPGVKGADRAAGVDRKNWNNASSATDHEERQDRNLDVRGAGVPAILFGEGAWIRETSGRFMGAKDPGIYREKTDAGDRDVPVT
jgi:hypothetical protein